MTHDEIIPLPQYLNASYEGDDLYTGKQLIEYAKLVAEKATEEANARANASWTLMCKKMVAFEREACANLCWKNEDDNAFINHGGKRLDLLCAELIKARGEA